MSSVPLTEQRSVATANSALDPRGWILSVIVFMGGITSIAVETGASRLIGPYFGTSTFIWANIIGLTLLYLTIGYFLGGRIADRWPRASVLFAITTAAGASIAITPYLARPILVASMEAFDTTNVGAFIGSLLGTLLLFAVPVSLLGMVSPYAVRLRVLQVEETGNTAGSLYALSTVGSILGSLAPAFLLIPLFGSRNAFIVLAIAILLPSLVAMLIARSGRGSVISAVVLVIVIALPFVWDQGLVRPVDYEDAEILTEVETPYNYIQVIQRGTETQLILNEGHAVHSIYDPTHILTEGPWDYFMIGSYFHPDLQLTDVNSLLMIGLAAGTVAKQFTEAYGPIPIDGVEIDQGIVDVGRDYFEMNEPNLDVIVADGRYYLAKTNKTYDVIGIDAYRQPYIPFHLTTVEFFQQVEDHLSDRGAAIVNAGRTETNFDLVKVIAATMDEVFDEVYLIDVKDFSNTMVIGINGDSSVEAFQENVQNLVPGSILAQVGQESLRSGTPRPWTDTAQVMRDNKAPIELVVDQIILEEAQSR